MELLLTTSKDLGSPSDPAGTRAQCTRGELKCRMNKGLWIPSAGEHWGVQALQQPHRGNKEAAPLDLLQKTLQSRHLAKGNELSSELRLVFTRGKAEE